jgi:hypothetical protein
MGRSSNIGIASAPWRATDLSAARAAIAAHDGLQQRIAANVAGEAPQTSGVFIPQRQPAALTCV